MLEADEIGVRCVQHGVVFDGQSRNLGVSHEVASGAEGLQQCEHLFDMIGTGIQPSDYRLRQPVADVSSRLRRRERMLKYTGIRTDAHEAEYDSLRQTHRLRPR